jgi:hypothetical protein
LLCEGEHLIVQSKILVAALILISACALYAWELYWQDSANVNVNYDGRALVGTVRSAFGLQPYITDSQRISISPEIVWKCKNSTRSDGADSCELVTANGAYYYKYCAWWRFENCTVLNLNSILLDYPVLMEQLEDVLSSPCKYLPTKGQIEQAIVAQKSSSNPHGLIVVNEFNAHRSTLKCDAPHRKSKRIVLYFGAESDKKFIKIITAR